MKSERFVEPIEEQGEQLREALEVERRRVGGVHQWRCSDALRERIVRHAAICSAEGESHRRIAGRLGVVQPTLSRWIREAAVRSSAFRHVAIVPAEPRERVPQGFNLRVVTPHGYIVEGLDLEHVVALLRVLG